MTNSSERKKVFVDADAFIAIVKSDDQNHSAAKDIFDRLCLNRIHFITSNYVFAEVVTVLSCRVGHESALRFIDWRTSQEENIESIIVDADIERKAVEIFRRQKSKNTSFMDCCHMACVNRFHLDAIFSFDHVYSQNNIPLASDLCVSP